MKRPLNERIEVARLRKAQLSARLAALESRAKAADRKRDTRRKIVVGAAVLVEMERTPQFAKFVRAMLDKAVTRPQDREAIVGLLQGAAEPKAPASNANEAPSLQAGDPSSAGQASGAFGVTGREKRLG